MSLFLRKFFSAATDNMIEHCSELFCKLSSNSHLISTMFGIRTTQLQNQTQKKKCVGFICFFLKLFCRAQLSCFIASYLVYTLCMWGEEIAQPNQYGNAKNQSILLHFMESFFFFICSPNLQLSFYHCHLTKVAKNIGICFDKKAS